MFTLHSGREVRTQVVNCPQGAGHTEGVCVQLTPFLSCTVICTLKSHCTPSSSPAGQRVTLTLQNPHGVLGMPFLREGSVLGALRESIPAILTEISEEVTMILPVLQVRKPKHRQVQQLAHGHTAHRQDLALGSRSQSTFTRHCSPALKNTVTLHVSST